MHAHSSLTLRFCMLGLFLGCGKETAFVFLGGRLGSRREDERDLHTYRLGFVLMREWNLRAFARLGSSSSYLLFESLGCYWYNAF
jgi:hypothetical protein